VSDELLDADYFYRIIDFSELMMNDINQV
jgi:hypothetical protein